MIRLTATFLGAALATSVLAAPAWAATEISFYYPIAVGGPITKIVDGYVKKFEEENPDIVVKPVYTGSYQARSSRR
jgi:sn-glycerol 3-phosphate transport system substrate-binding protein